MKRFEKYMPKDSTSIKSLTKNARGFTLIELLVALTIIAVLIALLLPVIQRKREAEAATNATRTVQQLGAAANYYRQQIGEYPATLPQLVQFVNAHPAPGIAIDPQDLSGTIYIYEVVEADQTHCKIEAEPTFPGITGALTLSLQITLENTMVSSFQTPGADEARERMFNRIRVKAAEMAVQILKQGFFFDIPAELQVRAFVDEAMASPNWLFNETAMDADGNGKITIHEIQNFNDPNMDSSLMGPLREFIAYAAQEMKWDRLSEASTFSIDIGTSENLESDQPPLFSYDGLAILTTTAITDGTSNTVLIAELLAKLEEAEAAEASGNTKGKMKAIKNYQKQIKAQIGQALTRTNAQMLITMSKTL
jgi:prepilin-type N-terminal cleavage/methylation domain-containing protein